MANHLPAVANPVKRHGKPSLPQEPPLINRLLPRAAAAVFANHGRHKRFCDSNKSQAPLNYVANCSHLIAAA
jgi:hypothetical protein